jgi:6-phosphofructokinase 1
MMSVRKIGVLTSGGDAPGMNAAIRAVVRTAQYYEIEVVGILRGYSGLLKGEFVEMNRRSVGDIIHRGGTILHTARCEEFKTEAGRALAVKNLQEAGIDGLVAIGGDGTFRGAMELHKLGVKVIGVPGTIDNDIEGTDYSIGFDTAVNTALEAINKIRDTATSHERISLVEVMGREAGCIALMSGLAGGAESILIPEKESSIQEVCSRIIEGRNRGKLYSIIIVAEGAGNSMEIGKKIMEYTGLETRVTILGHIQRGGSPTALDRIIATRMGAGAVELLKDGISGKAIGIQGQKMVAIDFAQATAKGIRVDREIYDLALMLAK